MLKIKNYINIYTKLKINNKYYFKIKFVYKKIYLLY